MKMEMVGWDSSAGCLYNNDIVCVCVCVLTEGECGHLDCRRFTPTHSIHHIHSDVVGGEGRERGDNKSRFFWSNSPVCWLVFTNPPDLYLHSQCCASGLTVLVHPVEGDTGL